MSVSASLCPSCTPPPTPPRSGGGGQGAAGAPNDSDTWAGREGGKGIPRIAAGSRAGGCEGGTAACAEPVPSRGGWGKRGRISRLGQGESLPLLGGGTPQPPSPAGKEDSALLPPSFSRSFCGVAPARAGEVKVARMEAAGGNERLPGSGSPSRPPPPAAACRRRTALGRPAEGAALGPRSAGAGEPPARPACAGHPIVVVTAGRGAPAAGPAGLPGRG